MRAKDICCARCVSVCLCVCLSVSVCLCVCVRCWTVVLCPSHTFVSSSLPPCSDVHGVCRRRCLRCCLRC